jgi:small-conductance mechanosensitive channel
MDKNQVLFDIDLMLNQLEDILFLFLPKLLLAIIIFLSGFILARIIRALINRFIDRMERMIPNKTVQKKLKQISIDPSTRLFSNLIYWIIIIFFLTAATEILGLPIITNWLGGLVNYLPNLLLAALLIFTGVIGGRLLRDTVNTAITKAGATYGDIVGQFAYYVIVVIAILLAITQIGVDLAILTGIIHIVLAAALFGATLAFGIGAKTSISNILACYYLQSRYKVGETVKIDNIEGQILEFTPTSLIMESDIGQITIPAKKFSEENSILIKKEAVYGSTDGLYSD